MKIAKGAGTSTKICNGWLPGEHKVELCDVHDSLEMRQGLETSHYITSFGSVHEKRRLLGECCSACSDFPADLAQHDHNPMQHPTLCSATET